MEYNVLTLNYGKPQKIDYCIPKKKKKLIKIVSNERFVIFEYTDWVIRTHNVRF